MKTGNRFYMQLSRAPFDENHHLSHSALVLFVWLNELEQRFTGEDKDWFLCTDEELCEFTGYSINTVKKAKAELKQTDLVEISRGKWIYTKTGKSGIKQPTKYRILR